MRPRVVSEGVIASVGVSNLQYVNLNSPRNLFVFGVSIILGLTIRGCLNQNPDVINTGMPFTCHKLSFTNHRY